MKDFYNWMEDQQQLQALLQQAMQNMNQGKQQPTADQPRPEQPQVGQQPQTNQPNMGQPANPMARKQELTRMINQAQDPTTKQQLQQQLAALG